MTQQLTGGFGDLVIKSYHDLADAVFQQKGSVLRPFITVERVMGGEDWFPKLGSSTSYEVVSRGAAVQPQDQFYERRAITPSMLESIHHINPLDVMRFARSPQPELAESIAMELGRKVDEKIVAAAIGTARRQLDGADSDASFDANFKVAINSNTMAGVAIGGAAMSGNTSLHEGKILQAKQLMESARANEMGDMPIVVANAKQLAGLHSRSLANPGAGWFQKNLPDMNSARVYQALDGYLGCRYVQYENLGLVTAGVDRVLIFLPKAIKLGIYSDLKFRVDELPQTQGTPTQIKANISLGAMRFYEEAIVEIACAATLAYA